jgi:hypothetical protein
VDKTAVINALFPEFTRNTGMIADYPACDSRNSVPAVGSEQK